MASTPESCVSASEDVVKQVSDDDYDIVNDELIPDEPNPHPWIGQECSNNASSLGVSDKIVGDVQPKLSSKALVSELQCESGQGDKVPAEDTKPTDPEVIDPVTPNIQQNDCVSNDSPACDSSPGVVSQDDDDDDDDDDVCIETAADERIACIEEEYIQRIAILEQRHNELEDVLSKLTVAIECGIAQHAANEKFKTSSNDTEVESKAASSNDDNKAEITDRSEPVETGEKCGIDETDVKHTLLLDMFIDFQHKIRQFAEDLNGVLNCSEAAIRHARVVQEWATSVQIMFEQIKEERHKILNYIDERERSMLVVKEQFIAELEEQGRQLQQLVSDMMSCRDLKEEGEQYCKKVDASHKRSTVERIVDMLLKKRLEEDRSIILGLSRQSKISEMKLFIIHQQSCIQQLQEQNRELRAIIEGLMGPDDTEDEDLTDSQQSGTPASVSTPDRCPIRETLDQRDEGTSYVSQVSQVLYCDRGEYLPGTSTDGDLATVQAYGIGKPNEDVETGSNIVFDPLSVDYVREQCQHAEETERQAHATLSDQGELTKGQSTQKDEIETLTDQLEDIEVSNKATNTADQRYIDDITKDFVNPQETSNDGNDDDDIDGEVPDKDTEKSEDIEQSTQNDDGSSSV
ncbi:hypothetical protein ACF0H5_016074 [Mactra antiquata]